MEHIGADLDGVLKIRAIVNGRTIFGRVKETRSTIVASVDLIGLEKE